MKAACRAEECEALRRRFRECFVVKGGRGSV